MLLEDILMFFLKNKSTRAQQILRVVVQIEWGADRQTQIKLYRTLLSSHFDYGIFVYRSARKSYLKQLDPIHHESLDWYLEHLELLQLIAYTPKLTK